MMKLLLRRVSAGKSNCGDAADSVISTIGIPILVRRHLCTEMEAWHLNTWWRHQMKTFFTSLTLCAGNSPHKGQWRGALIFSFICASINGWVNTREAGDLRRHRAHYEVIVMLWSLTFSFLNNLHIIPRIGKTHCVEFHMMPLKFQTKYLAHTLNHTMFIQFWKFMSYQT